MLYFATYFCYLIKVIFMLGSGIRACSYHDHYQVAFEQLQFVHNIHNALLKSSDHSAPSVTLRVTDQMEINMIETGQQ